MKLWIFLTLFSFTAAEVVQHQLIRVESRKTKMIKEGTWEAYNNAKQLAKSANRDATNFKSISQTLNESDDNEYLANVTVGTPEQQFLVVLDTGSADFWVPDSSCNSSSYFNDDQVCYGKHLFDSNKSSTYVKNGKPWKIIYMTGYAAGFLGRDTVGMGGIGEKKLVIPKTYFGQATEVAAYFQNDSINGILGLAFPSLSEEKVNPVLFNALKQGLLDKPIFTIYLQERGDEYNVPGGVITYGDLDTEHCSKKINYVPLTSDKFYQFKFDSFNYGNYSSMVGWQAISDSGTTQIVMPFAVYNDFIKNTNIKFHDDGTIDCNTKIDDLKLNIGGNEYIIPGKQLIFHETNGDCVFGIGRDFLIDDPPIWILGDPFIRAFCNVYHLKEKKIGFAKVKA